MNRRIRCAAALALLLFATDAWAQLQGGNLSGTVTDQQGGVLPGVTVTVTGSDRTQSFTTGGDGQFRFLNLPPGTYTVTVQLPGFDTVTRENIVVSVGGNVDLPITMGVAALQETVTVSGQSPIVDTRQTGTSTNVVAAELQNIPTSRDPWALMRTVPGVLVDRVNIGGNETGQQSNFASKGTRPQDAVWTLDGVVVTDMAAVGASPSYFNYDNFEEIQVSTAGQDIRQPTGGIGMNFVVKRGTNRFQGQVRGYFTNHSLEDSNVPDELQAAGITSDSADHSQQISDYGFELGGPIVRNKAWFYGSYSQQDVRLFRRSSGALDRTVLKNPNVKINWQATSKDMISGLYFNGNKIKRGRSPGTAGITFDAQTATQNQENVYPDNRPHGLVKVQDDRVFSPSLFVSGKYAYYGTGFILDPVGGLDLPAGRSFVLGRSFGSINQSIFLRPQHIVNVDGNWFRNFFGASHDIKFGAGWRRADASTTTTWPGDMVLAIENSLTDLRARVLRQGSGTNRAHYVNLYVGDTISKGRATIDVGVRYDRQNGEALPSTTVGNPSFPNLVPGIQFTGYNTPFTWNNVSPRVGLTYALDESRRTIARASFSRYAGQLETGIVGFKNPSSAAGFAEFPWTDLNGDHFAQPGEVDTTRLLATGNAFNPADPAAPLSADDVDPDLKAPVTTSVVAGVEREVMQDLAVQVNYTYTRTSDTVGNFTNNFQPFIGVTPADYEQAGVLTGTLPDGTPFNVPFFRPNADLVAANGGGRFLTNWPGYHTSYHGVDASLVKRLSNRWMARVGVAFNNAREFYEQIPPVNAFGNPTRTVTEPLVSGGQLAPQSGGSGTGEIYTNAKWQVNANGLYQLPWDLSIAANLFGRQGYPFPVFRTANLGRDGSANVLVTPEIDTLRYDDLWNVDLRVKKELNADRVRIQLIGDVFNVLNSNTVLIRNRALDSEVFNEIAQNLSPRIFRVGVIVGF